MKPKLLIDATSLLSQKTGIGRYTYENSSCMLDIDKKFDIYFHYGFNSKRLYSDSSKIGRISYVSKFKKILTKNGTTKKIGRFAHRLAVTFLAKKFDLYWQPNIIPNPNIKAKKIVSTVHDFSFIINPSWHPKERIKYFKENFFKNVKKSDHIITGSNYTKNEIMKYLNFSKKDITVIYHGVNLDIYKEYSPEELQATKEKYGLPENFLLFVGSIEPRKNLKNLLLAYEELKRNPKSDISLVLVGAKGWENLEILTSIKERKKDIRYIGFVDDIELAHIYNLAKIFVYPSLYEGFGIPPLEAFACKTPVVVSNTTSMPEVCGDCALFADPLKPSEIKEKIEILLKDKIIYDNLITKGYTRVKNFTWQNSAEKHLNLFKKLLTETVK